MEGIGKIIPGVLSGVLIGFSIGAGFIFAKKLLDRPKKTDPIEPVKQPNTKESNFSQFVPEYMFTQGTAKGFDYPTASISMEHNAPNPISANPFNWETGTFN